MLKNLHKAARPLEPANICGALLKELGTTWHTSSLWIRAEAERAIAASAAAKVVKIYLLILRRLPSAAQVNSTVLTMVVSAACGFLGALFFTHWDLLFLGRVFFGVQRFASMVWGDPQVKDVEVPNSIEAPSYGF